MNNKTTNSDVCKDTERSKRTVLVCDDESTTREMIKEYLSAHEINCVEAANGEEAIVVLSENVVDLALVDVRMPKMNGLQFLYRIKSVNSEFPVILMTGFELSKKEVALLPHKPDDFITKPFAMSCLLRLIKKHVSLK